MVGDMTRSPHVSHRSGARGLAPYGRELKFWKDFDWGEIFALNRVLRRLRGTGLLPIPAT
jgi:hypothetical protein